MKTKVSLSLLTLDRYDLTRRVVPENLKRAQHPEIEIEFLSSDNGSTDHRVVPFIKTLNPVYHRLNSMNEGCGKGHNQTFLRSTGTHFVTMANDILMPENWLYDMLSLYKRIPNAGVVGADWGHSCLPPLSKRLGIEARWLTPVQDRVFGCWLIGRRVIEEIGFAYEGYGVYGIEDSDYMVRLNLGGFNSCYHPTMRCEHLGHDVGEDSDYRRMKDKSLIENLAIFQERLKRFDEDGITTPLPPLRDPL